MSSHEDSVADLAYRQRAQVALRQLQSGIRTGDLVTRTGRDFTSESLRSLNQRDQTFSHCGIASIEHDSIFVYHALGGEFNPDQKIRRDPLEFFAEPGGNKRIGIFRFAGADSLQARYAAAAKKGFEMGIMFDMDFDLKTDDRMYCAEFVSKSFETASNGKLHFDHSRIKTFEFIGVDDIFLHPLCKKLAELVYK